MPPTDRYKDPAPEAERPAAVTCKAIDIAWVEKKHKSHKSYNPAKTFTPLEIQCKRITTHRSYMRLSTKRTNYY